MSFDILLLLLLYHVTFKQQLMFHVKHGNY